MLSHHQFIFRLLLCAFSLSCKSFFCISVTSFRERRSTRMHAAQLTYTLQLCSLGKELHSIGYSFRVGVYVICAHLYLFDAIRRIKSGFSSCFIWPIYRVRWIICRLNIAKMKITLTDIFSKITDKYLEIVKGTVIQ